jgi:hypothetical protein
MKLVSHESFGTVARREFSFLEGEFGFHVAEERDELVRFESSSVVVTAELYPGNEGQLNVTAKLAGHEDDFERLTVSSRVGRGPVAGVLHLAAERLRHHRGALRGDVAYYERLGQAQRHESRKWTAYYLGQGPRPTGRLPRLAG